jgi:hypothetical protein
VILSSPLPVQRLWLSALILSAAWLGGVAALAWLEDWRIGRYANSFSAEYAVHCWKRYDVEFGRERVQACIDGRIALSEAAEIRQRTIETYFSNAAWRAAFGLSVPLLLLSSLAVWSQVQGSRTSSVAPTYHSPKG